MSLSLLHSSKAKFVKKARNSIVLALATPPEGIQSPDERYGDPEKNQAKEKQVTFVKFFTSFCLTFFVCFCYLWGIVSAARVSVFWEMVITFFFPVCGFLFGWERWTSKRQRELIMLEGTYNVFVIITKLLIQFNHSQGSEVMSYFFLGFFFLQVGGFLRHQSKERQWVGFTMSLTMACSIGIQRWEMRDLGYNPQTANLYCHEHVIPTLKPYALAVYKKNCIGGFKGQFLMWGMEAGPMMKLNYLYWVSNVLLVDYSKFLPAMIIPAVHYGSVIMGFYAVEFWHVRLLTASHLFVLDGITLYKYGTVSKDWCKMPSAIIDTWKTYIVPTVAFLCLILCILCPIFAGICGQQSLYCINPDTGKFMGPGTNGTLYREFFNATLPDLV